MIQYIRKEITKKGVAPMNLPQNVEFLIARLNAASHRADVVGGCVRDFLLGKEPNDYDITTDATPDEMREIFSDMRTVDTGIKHGTLTVICDSLPYEITTYRVDGEYTDNRHPDFVSFTRRVADDLARRDFTVNAMCYNHTDGLTDLYSGREDLQKKVIRAVGDPMRRFGEDALRILRALRFAATLDFEIEENTSRAAIALAQNLSSVSSERILIEWRKLVAGKAAYRIINEYKNIISLIIPSLQKLTLPEKKAFDSASPTIRELSLFASEDSPAEAYASAMRTLKSDNKSRDFGKTVLENLNESIKNDSELGVLLSKIGEECTRGVLQLSAVLGKNFLDVSALDSLIKSGLCYKLSDLEIGGCDLISLGIRGSEIGKVLSKLLFLVASGQIKNEKKALLASIKG